MTAIDLATVLPEVILAAYAMLALLAGVYFGKDALSGVLTWATAGMFAILALLIAFGMGAGGAGFGGLIVDDAFARFAKVAILLSSAAVLIMAQDYMARRDLARFEYPILISLAVIGMMVMVSAANLMTLYMGLELQSLALYVITALRRDSVKSTEAGLKYFVLGALSSGLLLYGASLIYGFAGTTDFAAIMAAAGQELSIGVLIGMVFVLAGMAFKVSAAPFHMWTPDVYEGAPTPITAFLATAPKLAAMALIARVVHDAFGTMTDDWYQVLAALSVVSMFLGAIAAIGQRDIKRLMAYSSIAHMGFALMGLASGTLMGVQAMLVYMAIYITMNLGTFAFILSLERGGRAVTDIAALHQFSKSEPMKALALLVLMFSLAGVPPMLGFWGKFNVMLAAYDAGLAWLALAGGVASVIGAFYYLRIVYFIYFGAEAEPATSRMSPVQWTVFVAAALAVVLGTVNLFGIEGPAAAAAAALLG
ncbi:MAG: NADH-quinone oxidoreductase subunit NuoN [Cypionkella sp.]|nr:NADH-quinone oxidoreductase subunit NuoN [Cypionkella sp.]